MNLYNRNENSSRVDRVALSGIAHVGMRPTPRPVGVPNDVFAGKDGKVYRRDQKGNWRVNEGRSWRGTSPPSAPRAWRTPGDDEKPKAQRPDVRSTPRPAPVRQPAPGASEPPPGNLEREFRARQRANEKVVARPAPSPPKRAERPKRESEKREAEKREPEKREERRKDDSGNKERGERRR
jgi:hypothetical protein